MSLNLRIANPSGGYFTQHLTENMAVTTGSPTAMKTEGQMYGLSFKEDWYVPVLASDHAIVRYRGRTLQGPYEGGFVYARDSDFLKKGEGRAAVEKEWKEVSGGGDFSADFKDIDNSCPATFNGGGEIERREATKATLAEWKDLVLGEGGIGDWIRPGWRGEYKQ